MIDQGEYDIEADLWLSDLLLHLELVSDWSRERTQGYLLGVFGGIMKNICYEYRCIVCHDHAITCEPLEACPSCGECKGQKFDSVPRHACITHINGKPFTDDCPECGAPRPGPPFRRKS